MEKRRINVRAIVWRDGKLLAVKHKNSDGSESDYWALPGGGLDPFETMQNGVKRELLEEVGVDATIGKLLFLQQFHSNREGYDEEFELLFEVKDSELFDSIDLNKTSHGNVELARVEFINPKEVHIKPTFLSEIDIAAYIKAESAPYIYTEL